jgi:AmmeMemoRadiSam system protein A
MVEVVASPGVELSEGGRQALLGAARRVICAAVAGELFDPGAVQPWPNDELRQPAGSFVSLHQGPRRVLRGCVGQIDAEQPLWLSVCQSARDVLHDPRFARSPVLAWELPELDVEISVISPLRAAAAPGLFDPMNDGIYLLWGERAGCFLPQVARETGWTREQLLNRLCTEKLGVAAGTWRDPRARLMLFTTIIIGPEPLLGRSVAVPGGPRSSGGPQ